MKPQYKKKFISASGVDNTLQPQLGTADAIINCRYSDNGGWIANIGTESWYNFPSNFSVPLFSAYTTYFQSPVDAVFQWAPSNSNTSYTFVEQNGRLYYFLGNKGTGNFFSDITIVDDNRHIRKDSEIGTQFINLGTRLLIINGRDKAILFAGDKVWRDFSFQSAAGVPTTNAVETHYEDGTERMLEGTAIWFSTGSTLGLGTGDDKPSQYSWKVTYITDTGSESPFSDAETQTWTSASLRYAVSMELPCGGEGVVARRIYRTKNIQTDGEIFYFEKQINENASRWYVSFLPDTLLQTPAPSVLDSTTISTDYQFGDVWDGRLWLAKDSTIIYSQRGLLEQFGAANYFDVSNLTGGSITQIKAYYNNLIVFRETAINVISSDSNGGYVISTINSSIGTTASNSIVLVPQLGIVFMNQNGVWNLSGGLNGGSTININKISHKIDKTLKDTNKSMLHRTTAAYSPKEEIVWFHYPDSVNTIPNRGIMLHLIPDVPMWGFFGNPDGDESVYYPAITTTIDGYFLMGTAQVWDNTIDKIGASTKQFGALQVLSVGQKFGQQATTLNNAEVLQFSVIYGDPVGYLWESSWINFGDNSTKNRVYSVELEVISQGDNAFDFYYAKDYSYETSNTTAQKQAKGENVFTSQEPPVFGLSDPKVSKSFFAPNTSIVQDGILIQMRYDVNTQLANQFKFGLKSDTPFQLLSFNILFDDVEMPVLNQATRLQKGQSR